MYGCCNSRQLVRVVAARGRRAGRKFFQRILFDSVDLFDFVDLSVDRLVAEREVDSICSDFGMENRLTRRSYRITQTTVNLSVLLRG